jgi:hypothetical protein
MARNWAGLSDSTRRRYERAGVSRAAYESGASLRAARGHATTPERPEAGRNRPEFQQYHQVRDDIMRLKREIFGRVGKGAVKEMKGKRRASLIKGRDLLQEMVDNQVSWHELVMMFPEFEDHEWDWVKHYH